MSTWDNSPQAASWDNTPAAGDWTDVSKTPDKDDGINASRHNQHGDGARTVDDGGCRNCHQPGHFARDCPEERTMPPMSEGCFNCGEPGHMKSECPNPRVERAFTGTCRYCQAEGHRAAECPNKPAEKCRNCLQEGHKASECQANRVVDNSKVPDMDKAAAWALLKKAAEERETVEFREALKIYTKGDESITYPQLEQQFRDGGIGIYLIAMDKEIPRAMTNVNLQGKTGCKYSLGFYFKPTPTRKILEQYWPSTPEENMERLKDAGETLENTIPLCRNCNELGHISKDCGQEKVGPAEAVDIVCSNCSEVGHRLRDCTKERAPRGGTCRNCNQPGHKASECTEERSAANVECRRCNEMGHFSKDCPNNQGGGGGCRNCGEEGHFAKDCDKPKNPANMVCRNCDQTGHGARECPEPKDWSRVKCNNCGESEFYLHETSMGHTVKRCTQPVPEADNSFEGGVEDMNTGNSGTTEPGATWDTPAVVTEVW